MRALPSLNGDVSSEEDHRDVYLPDADEGMFAEGLGKSARIEQLAVGAGERIAIVATSYERPDQHGIGSYRLERRAD